MYSGKIEMIWEHMTECMAVTNYLGVVFLHHKLENTLKAMTSEPTTRIEAVNVASHPTTGVSLETASQILQTIHERYAPLSMEEIMVNWAAICKCQGILSIVLEKPFIVVNAEYYKEERSDRLRVPQNIVWIDAIINNIFIEDMNSQELLAFQRTLRALSELPSYTNVASTMSSKSENCDSEDSLDYCSDRNQGSLSEKDESQVEETRRLPPAKEVFRQQVFDGGNVASSGNGESGKPSQTAEVKEKADG
ncbi:unnamed protein product [Angiostrongylus costaricensis]|uniref:DUF4378 domain-containing protein n=1 Tax=Angiostrongylus costaricensis TaxID=334426 RepID=A0A0R3PS33_ANGCS|nr:unnamed protein product [Angiostrongylus costaricensis]